MSASSTNLINYDDQIDAMLIALRAEQQEKSRKKKEMYLRKKYSVDVEKNKNLAMQQDIAAGIFTPMVERMKKTDDSNTNNCETLSKQKSFFKTFFRPSSLLTFPEECTKIRKKDSERHKLMENENTAVAVAKDDTLIERLTHELRSAREENALLRREMYGALVTIDRYLARLSGENNCDCKEEFNGLNDIDDFELSSYLFGNGGCELYAREKISFAAEDMMTLHELREIIASTAERCRS